MFNIKKTASLAPVVPDRLMLHEMACAYAEEQFKLQGGAESTWILASGSNVAWVETPFNDAHHSKNVAAFVIRGLLKGTSAQAYSYVSEVWYASFGPDMTDDERERWTEFATHHGVSELPPHMRDDMLLVMSHDRDGGLTSSRYLVTTREPGKGLSFLGPRIDETEPGTLSGRLFDLFAKEKVQ